VFGRHHRAERGRRSDVRAAKELGVTGYAVRQAERVKEADPEVFDQLNAGTVSLPEAVRVVEARETRSKLDAAIERYPFLRDVPGHPLARLVEIAVTLDAADDGDRAGMEDQARRWCDAQRELVPQWRAEDEVTRMLDGITSRLAHVNSILSRHGAAEIAELLMGRLMPDNDIAIVRMARGHLSELERELASRQQIRRVK
jgi:hypothetical protein